MTYKDAGAAHIFPIFDENGTTQNFAAIKRGYHSRGRHGGIAFTHPDFHSGFRGIRPFQSLTSKTLWNIRRVLDIILADRGQI